MTIQSKVQQILASPMTQQQVADLVGCSQATISELASGVQKTTKLEIGLKLLELHNTTVRKAA